MFGMCVFVNKLVARIPQHHSRIQCTKSRATTACERPVQSMLLLYQANNNLSRRYRRKLLLSILISKRARTLPFNRRWHNNVLCTSANLLEIRKKSAKFCLFLLAGKSLSFLVRSFSVSSFLLPSSAARLSEYISIVVDISGEYWNGPSCGNGIATANTTKTKHVAQRNSHRVEGNCFRFAPFVLRTKLCSPDTRVDTLIFRVLLLAQSTIRRHVNATRMINFLTSRETILILYLSRMCQFHLRRECVSKNQMKRKLTVFTLCHKRNFVCRFMFSW